jgi:hypothetical protein
MLQREYQLARLVEAHIEVELTNYSELEVFSTPYRNGREKGFVFSHYDGKDAEGRVRPVHVFAFESRHTGSFLCVTSTNDLAYTSTEYGDAESFLPQASKGFKIADHILTKLLGQNWRAK